MITVLLPTCAVARQHSSEVSKNGVVELDNVVRSWVGASRKIRNRVLTEPLGENERVIASAAGENVVAAVTGYDVVETVTRGVDRA